MGTSPGLRVVSAAGGRAVWAGLTLQMPYCSRHTSRLFARPLSHAGGDAHIQPSDSNSLRYAARALVRWPSAEAGRRCQVRTLTSLKNCEREVSAGSTRSPGIAYSGPEPEFSIATGVPRAWAMTSGPLVSPTELRRGSRTASAAARTSENVESSGSSTRDDVVRGGLQRVGRCRIGDVAEQDERRVGHSAGHSNQLVDALGRAQAAGEHQQVPVVTTKQAGPLRETAWRRSGRSTGKWRAERHQLDRRSRSRVAGRPHGGCGPRHGAGAGRAAASAPAPCGLAELAWDHVVQRHQAAPTPGERHEKRPARVGQVGVQPPVAPGTFDEAAHRSRRPPAPRPGGSRPGAAPATSMARRSAGSRSSSAARRRGRRRPQDHREVPFVHAERGIVEQPEPVLLALYASSRCCGVATAGCPSAC